MNNGLVEVKGLRWEGKTIYIDGYDFSNCLFENCNLITHTGMLNFSRCRMTMGTKVVKQDMVSEKGES